MKAIPVPNPDGTIVAHGIFCPGCKSGHTLFTDLAAPHQAKNWGFNRNLESPTFTPSLLVSDVGGGHRCHSYITDGRIQFLGDSDHELKGQMVDLPDINKMAEEKGLKPLEIVC